MTRFIFDLEQEKLSDSWTTSRLKDEFSLSLMKFANKKYYDQAKNLIFRIPLTEQYPKSEIEALMFTIDFGDIPPKVQEEFLEFCKLYNKGQVRILLKEVVMKLFENLDYDYAHSRVMKKLRIKIVS